MDKQEEVLVIGSTGLVGSAILEGLLQRGWSASGLPAPRLTCSPRGWRGSLNSVAASIVSEARGRRLASLRIKLGKILETKTIVNAAGLATPNAKEMSSELLGANALLPAVIAASVEDRKPVPRFVHVSSAAACGNLCPIDAGVDPRLLSIYGMSKALGELALLDIAPDAVAYRPTSVMAVDRPLSRRLGRAIEYRLLPADANGVMRFPLQTLESLGRAVVGLVDDATCSGVVLHPDEGWTAARLYALAGNSVPPWGPWLRIGAQGVATIAPTGTQARISLLADGGWVADRSSPQVLRDCVSVDNEMARALGLQRRQKGR